MHELPSDIVADHAHDDCADMRQSGCHSGRTIADYHVGDLIGVGGKAFVYEARNVAHGRRVALKVMPTAAVRRDGLRREAASIAALDHPHVVRVHESGETERLRFLAMELIDGGTLQDRLRAGDLALVEAMRILQEIASALDAAHVAGLVHLDVKPSNILVDQRGHSYLADFGLALWRDDAVHTDAFFGTATYAAPEQFLGDPVTPASDVYALAAVLCECIAGQPPFKEPALEEHALTARTDLPHVESGDGPRDQSLSDVLRRGLEHRPGERFRSATDLIDAARRALRDASPALLRRPAGRVLAPADVAGRHSSAPVDVGSAQVTE